MDRAEKLKERIMKSVTKDNAPRECASELVESLRGRELSFSDCFSILNFAKEELNTQMRNSEFR